MNYEEKYNEVLKSMRDLYNKMKYLSSTDALETTVTLENTFPELKESEDERIKKEIIQFLQLPHPQFVGKRNYEEWIAWLEKQGEQKPVEQDTETRDLWVYIREWNEKFGRLPKDEDELAACIDYVMKRQKPANKIEQNHSWSEEDEKMLQKCINELESERDTRSGWPNCMSEINWLKSFKDRIQPQPKQEWSEDDESMLTRCIGILGKCYMGELPTKVEEELEWLKSIEPNHWKPSEEQMKALNTAVAVFRGLQGTYPIKDIESLYNNLKTI